MSQPTLLRYEDVLARLREAVAGREDYVYTPVTVIEDDEDTGESFADELCLYLEDDNTPSCIIGQAFALDIVEIGVTPLSEVNRDGVSTLFGKALKSRFRVTRRAARFLAHVQLQQDCGTPWGDAIQTAIQKASPLLDDTVAFESVIWV